jgi:two-component system NarL family sensor kinase
LRLEITDDGSGFDLDDLRDGHQEGFGLERMKDSVERLGGELLLRSRAESGTQVEVLLP